MVRRFLSGWKEVEPGDVYVESMKESDMKGWISVHGIFQMLWT